MIRIGEENICDIMKVFLARISREDLKNEERKNFSSREEYLRYKWRQQEEVVKKHFNIKRFDRTFYDSGSAYDQEKFKNRTRYHELLEFLFDYSETTLKDLFWGKIEPHKELSIYVYDYNRFSRRMEYSLLFSLLCDMHNIQIYSYNQPMIRFKANEEAMEKGTRYLLTTMTALNGEQYSESTSKNIRKSSLKKDGLTLSYKDKLWGKGFKDVNGKELSIKKTRQLKQNIRDYISAFEKQHMKGYYPEIQKVILRDYNVNISKAVITRIKADIEGDER